MGNVSLEASMSAMQLVVDHSTFRDSKGWGIYVAPCTATSAKGAVTVDANTTYMNDAAGMRGPATGCM